MQHAGYAPTISKQTVWCHMQVSVRLFPITDLAHGFQSNNPKVDISSNLKKKKILLKIICRQEMLLFYTVFFLFYKWFQPIRIQNQNRLSLIIRNGWRVDLLNLRRCSLDVVMLTVLFIANYHNVVGKNDSAPTLFRHLGDLPTFEKLEKMDPSSGTIR